VTGRAGILLCLLALGSCGNDASGDELLGRVHGTVREADTRKAVKGARVRFLSDTLDEDTDTTDRDGTFRVSAVTDTANGRLEVTKRGYQKRIVSVYLDDESVNVDVDLLRE
jgi:hypothetical protein